MRSKPQQNAWTIDLEIARLVGQYCSMWGISSVTVIELSLLVLELTIDLMQPVACIVSNLIFLSSTYEAVWPVLSLAVSSFQQQFLHTVSVFIIAWFSYGEVWSRNPKPIFSLYDQFVYTVVDHLCRGFEPPTS